MDNLDIDKTIEVEAGNRKSESLQAGSLLGQYKIIRLLGRGGMGEVYEVEHITLAHRYALKILPDVFSSNPSAIKRFRREAKIMAHLDHPNIIKVDDFGQDDGKEWLRMELAVGGDINERQVVTLKEYVDMIGGAVPQDELVEILRQLAKALKYANDKGVVHRDLKPSNILFCAESDGDDYACVPKISDFGLVRLVGEDWLLSQVQISVQHSLSIGQERTMEEEGASTISMLGTYEYMSPEQKRGEEADKRSDIYSLGLMTFKLLTGENPGTKPPSRINSSLAVAWDHLVEKALEEKAENRLADCAEFLKSLDTVEKEINPGEGPKEGEVAKPEPIVYVSTEKNNTGKDIARWIFFLPSAIAGSWLCGIIVKLVLRLGESINPLGGVSAILANVMSYAVTGASFVYIGCYVAPKFKKAVAIALGSVILMLAGAMLVTIMISRSYGFIYCCISVGVGAIVMGYGIFTDQVLDE